MSLYFIIYFNALTVGGVVVVVLNQAISSRIVSGIQRFETLFVKFVKLVKHYFKLLSQDVQTTIENVR